MTTTRTEHTDGRALAWHARLTAVLLAAFLAQLAVFGYLAYRRYWQATRPANIVATAEEAIERYYPDARDAVRKELIKAAPALADRLSRRAVASVPEARERLAAFLDRRLDAGLDAAAEFSADQFREFLRENRDFIRQSLAELKDVPAEAERFVLDLEKRIEARLGADLQKQARAALAAHRALNDKLERLAADRGLDPAELLERRIVRLLRAMEQDAVRGGPA